MEPKLYLLALFALKLDPGTLNYTEHPDGSVTWTRKNPTGDGEFPPVSLEAIGVVAESEEQAWAHGMEYLLGAHPWQDGWVNHHVTVNRVPRANLLRAAADAIGDHGDDDARAVIM